MKIINRVGSVLATKYGLGFNKILGTIHIHPTSPEANKYVFRKWQRAYAGQCVLAGWNVFTSVSGECTA